MVNVNVIIFVSSTTGMSSFEKEVFAYFTRLVQAQRVRELGGRSCTKIQRVYFHMRYTWCIQNHPRSIQKPNVGRENP